MENLPKGVIFHVEDDSDWQEMIGRLLEGQGHTMALSVGTVGQALAAIPETLEALGINIAILDGDLPDGAGEQVAIALRESQLPVGIIGLSGRIVGSVDISISKLDASGITDAVNANLRDK